ncbi:MAG: ribulose-phosphate 3-epimerase [Acholeplasmatales bacterium]|jgi:ribulose-phosphate 3-epimerase|nr:ribulose-phosphate 3-epimerase [Acholeplasmatales bacterium]
MKISPSILTSDFSKLEKEIKSISKSDYIHFDIMDGNFVPNISFGPYISSVISKISNVKLDIHLMVMDPLKWISKFIFENTEYITVHIESKNVKESIKLIKERGKKAGICLKPGTSVSTLYEILPYIDLVLVMSVEPGFGGQKFISSSKQRINELLEYRKNKNLKFVLEVDGGINDENIDSLREVDIVVIGSYLFNLKNRNKIITDFQKK